MCKVGAVYVGITSHLRTGWSTELHFNVYRGHFGPKEFKDAGSV